MLIRTPPCLQPALNDTSAQFLTPKRLNFRRLRRARRSRRSKRFALLSRILSSTSSTSNNSTIPQTSRVERPKALRGRADRSPLLRVVQSLARLVLSDSNSAEQTDQGNSLGQDSAKWARAYGALLKLKADLERRERSPAARVYNLRMYDLVLGHERPTMTRKETVGGGWGCWRLT